MNPAGFYSREDGIGLGPILTLYDQKCLGESSVITHGVQEYFRIGSSG